MVFQQILSLLPVVASEIVAVINSTWKGVYNKSTPASSDDERNDVMRIVKELSDNIADIDTIVRALMSHREVLEEERLSQLRRISIMHRIPPEILSDIFVRSAAIKVDFFIDDPYPNFHEDVSGGRKLTLNVAQVCRRWKEIALATPQLWSLISPCNTESGNLCPSLAAELYSRSRTSLIHLICHLDGYSRLRDAPFSLLLDKVKHRCVGLDIEIQEDDVLTGGGWFTHISDWVADSTSLRRLTLCPLVAFPSDMSLRLSHLTHLYFTAKGGTALSDVTGMRWDSLRCLIVDAVGASGGVLWSRLHVNFPKLETLCLTDDKAIKPHSTAAGGFPGDGAIVHPNIQALNLTCNNYRLPDAIDSYNLGCAFPSLRHLALTWNTIDNNRDSIIRILERMETPLRSLVLFYGDYPPSPEHEAWLRHIGERFSIRSVHFAGWWHHWHVYVSTMEEWYDPYVTAV